MGRSTGCGQNVSGVWLSVEHVVGHYLDVDGQDQDVLAVTRLVIW